jgi:ubiquinone/menaquinone biosynthesis C-methylase UbiE
MRLSTIYDLINAAIFLPWGGSRRTRRELVRGLRIWPGEHVLDLGCGTGLVTAQLVHEGAVVTGIDRLPGMLEGARRRSPQATLIEADVLDGSVDDGAPFDAVTLSFVLHNFDPSGRVTLLQRAASGLAGGSGRVGLLEWAEPTGRLRGRTWRWFLARLEPSPSVPQILDGALDAEVADAGLQVVDRRDLCGGRVQLLVLRSLRVGP